MNGNILSKVETVNGTSTTHTYQYGNSQWRDLLTSYDGDAITYDAGGNPLTYRDGITFTWQNGRQLASYEDDAYRITYDYNDSGIRVKKTVTDKATGTVTVTENYLEGVNVIAQKITTTPIDGSASTEIIWYIYDGTGAVVGMQTEDGTYYYEKNLQGDITAIITDSGAEVVSYKYDAWGNILFVSDISNVDLEEKNPYTYREYYRDNETGFYYLQSRYYDAEMGRFINADSVATVEFGLGWKRFVFARKILIKYPKYFCITYSNSRIRLEHIRICPEIVLQKA